MAMFAVTLELTGHVTVKVEADDVLEARESAQSFYSQYPPADLIEEVMPISVTDASGDEVWSL